MKSPKNCDKLIKKEKGFCTMKKSLLSVIMILLTSLAFCACSSSDILSQNDDAQTIDEKESNSVIDNEQQNTIELSLKDKNTKKIIIELPEDFTATSYQRNLIPQKEFQFGEYIPFVEYAIDRYTIHNYINTRAFLTSGVSSLEEGQELYNKLNSKYLLQQPVTAETNENHDIERDFLFKSSVTDVSEDLSEIERTLFIDMQPDTQEYFLEKEWEVRRDIIKNDEVIKSQTQKHDFIEPKDFTDVSVITPKEYGYLLKKDVVDDSDFVYYSTHLDEADFDELFLYVYSLDDYKMKYEFVLPWGKEIQRDEKNSVYSDVVGITDNRYVTLEYHVVIDDVLYQSVYVLDMTNNIYTHIEDFAFNPVMSPDGKYLAYTSPVLDQGGARQDITNLTSMERGFYVKDISTGKTVFYPYKNARSTYCVKHWVLEQPLLNLIG